MNQMACNSPHVVLWIGKNQNNLVKDTFWNNLNEYAKLNFNLDSKMNIDKIERLYSTLASDKKIISKIKKLSNRVHILKLKKNIKNIEHLRGFAGIFFDHEINDLSDIKKFITKKCQTVVQYGFHDLEIKKEILKSNLLGIDRIVPFGKSLEFEINWDGYDVIRSLSRIINTKN